MAKISFKFDPDQPHQIWAIESIIGLFEGIPKQEELVYQDDVLPNLPEWDEIDEELLFDNLIDIQKQNGLHQNSELDIDEGAILNGLHPDIHRYPLFTVEMETGTGKTYVYLRSIYELSIRFGFGKYIIVVPSVAIYEGVIKSFSVMREHFKSIYHNHHVELMEYAGAKIGCVKSFAGSHTPAILLMTIDSFNSVSNNLYKRTEKIPGEKLPYHYIQEARPIIILDENQNYQSERAKEALRTLKPLFALNFSATPINKSNQIYFLSPVDAFSQNLVKKIEVMGITEKENYNESAIPPLVLNETNAGKYYLEGKLDTIHKGQIVNKEIKLYHGDDVAKKTKNDKYTGYVIKEINISENKVIFENNEEIYLDEGGALTSAKKECFRIQLEETIKEHFMRQHSLLSKRIKVLSLFFIDRVANYRGAKPVIRELFDEAYEKIKKDFPFYQGWEPHEVREGYFASVKTKNSEDFIDTCIDEGKKTKKEKELEKEAYNLIMKDKEKLLSFDEKKAFIFAHSALKEGWDNPNVFQICTLNATVSERKKRQEIGRGLRIAVNQDGERIQDEDVNILTVIANESYEDYVSQLQDNYLESGDVAPPAPTAKGKSEAKRNDVVFNSINFRNLWQKLTQKTDYYIKLNKETFVKNSIQKLNDIQFPEPKIAVSRGRFVISTIKIKLTEVGQTKCGLDIVISDSDNNIRQEFRKFKKGDDLAKWAGDSRLKGYKIVEIKYNGDNSEIHFSDRGALKIGDQIEFSTERGQKTVDQELRESEKYYSVPDFISRVTKDTGITRKTAVDIFTKLKEEQQKYIFKNPEGFLNIFIHTVKGCLADHIADNIEYFLRDVADPDETIDEVFPEFKMFPQKELIKGENRSSLYDYVQIDSDVEKRFVEKRLNPDGKVICYFKFPGKFKINMPKVIENYNPDWGVIRLSQDGQYKLELVRETKGNINPNLLQFPNERRKIACAARHFKALGVSYRQITDEVDDWWEEGK